MRIVFYDEAITTVTSGNCEPENWLRQKTPRSASGNRFSFHI